MKAEMGQKLSTVKKGDRGGLGYRRAKKTPADAPGLKARQYGGKAVGSAYCAGPDGIDALEGMRLTALTQSPHLASVHSEAVRDDNCEVFERR
jgi:hypothetical protein